MASKKQGQSTGPGDSTIVTTENRARFEAEYEKTEQALLKPSLGGNTHVINLAQFERFSRDVELTARRQKRSKNGTSVPPSVAGAGRSRAPTPDLLVVGGDSRPSSGTGYLSVHRPSHVRASISMEARPRASISPVPDPPVTTGPQLSLAPPPATAQTQRSNAQSHRSGARTPSPARGSLSPLSKAAQDRASSALAMHSSGLSPPALKKSDLTTLVTAMKPKPRFHGIVRKLCRMDYMDITWLTDLASGAPLPAARLTIDNMSDDVLLKFKSEEEVNTVLLNSPRSVLTSLRLGINPMDVQQRPMSHFTIEGPGIAVPEHLAKRRQEFFENQRQSKLKVLHDEYHEVCGLIDFDQLVSFFRQYDHNNPSSANAINLSLDGEPHEEPTEQGLEQKREKFRKTLEAKKREIEKRLRYAEDLQQGVERAAEERSLFEQKQKARREADRRAKQEKALQQKQKQAEWKQHLEDLELENERQVQERQKLLAQKERLHAQMMAENHERKKQELQAKQARNLERLNANKAKMATILDLQKQKLEEKEMLADKKRHALEVSRAQERKSVKVKAQQVAEHRKQIALEGVRRLEQQQQELQERQQQAEERLNEFMAQQCKLREQRQEQERLKDVSRKQVFQAAKAEEQRKRDHLIEKQQQQEESFKKHISQKEAANRIATEEAALARAARNDFLERKRRIQEFEQLRTIDGLQRKTDRIHQQEQRKERMIQDIKSQRIEMEVQKSKMLAQLDAKCTSLGLV